MHVAEVFQPIWPLLLQVTFLKHRRKSWMVTFASEVVQKSLTGVRPDDPEANPLTFVIIAIRCVSRMIHLCYSQTKPCFDSYSPLPVRGVTQWTNRTEPLTGGRYGTLVYRRIVKFGLPDQHTVTWACFLFWAKNRRFPPNFHVHANFMTDHRRIQK